jgi:outer membrane protein OmpA-like peptidoglycan-associated protein
MKQFIAMTAVTMALMSVAANANQTANEVNEVDPHPGIRSALVFGSAITGALLGGPIGYAAGTYGGLWLKDRVVDGFELEIAEAALADEQASSVELHRRLAAADTEQKELQRFAMESLQLRVLFHTGESQLDSESQQRIERLAQFLAQQPQLHVQLSGYADPRGDEIFNDTLSADRVTSVVALMESQGVNVERIRTAAYGESQSLAAEGDLDTYAFERRVDIQLLNGEENAALASAR